MGAWPRHPTEWVGPALGGAENGGGPAAARGPDLRDEAGVLAAGVLTKGGR